MLGCHMDYDNNSISNKTNLNEMYAVIVSIKTKINHYIYIYIYSKHNFKSLLAILRFSLQLEGI